MPDPLLAVSGLRAGYGATEILRGVDLTVGQGEIVAVLGSNGAGKSTLNRAISGMLRPWTGSIRFDDGAIERERAAAIVAGGLIHVPEGRRIFARLTVEENLAMGAFTRRDRPAIQQDKERMLSLFPRLRERLKQVAGTLSGGEQQMAATARALMGRPRVLLMDEPSMGLSPVLVEQVFETIRAINEQGVAILLVEQNALMALDIADYAYVMESGRIVLTGRGKDLLEDEKVQRAYLG